MVQQKETTINLSEVSSKTLMLAPDEPEIGIRSDGEDNIRGHHHVPIYRWYIILNYKDEIIYKIYCSLLRHDYSSVVSPWNEW